MRRRSVCVRPLNGAETLLAVLVRCGVDRIFASPGSEWAALWEALARARSGNGEAPEYLSVGHEELAVSMASGWAKATGRLPAVVLHTTVGSMHATMALRAAKHEQIPMVVLAGESVAWGEDSGPDPGAQWLAVLSDIGGPSAAVERSVKWSSRVPAAEVLASMVQRAGLLAREAPSGPVFLSVPVEYLTADGGALPPGTRLADPTAGDSAALFETADALMAADRPLIVAEDSGLQHKTVPLLVDLAEKVGARVVETRGARYTNFPRSHPLHCGFAPADLVDDADEILLVGSSGPWHPSSRELGSSTGLTVIGENPLRSHVPYWGYPVTRVIPGDIGASLELLLAQVGSGVTAAPDRLGAIGAINDDRRARLRDRARSESARSPITARWAALALAEGVPDGTTIVDETLTARTAILEMTEQKEAGSWYAGALGGLGTALGTTLGVRLATASGLVVCTIGDGSVGYEPAFAALGASRELGLPFLMYVMNNQGYLSQKAPTAQLFPEGFAVRHNDFPGLENALTPDYRQLAAAFGGAGWMVADPLELPGVIDAAVAHVTDGSFGIIDVRLEPTSSLKSRGD
ncbi:MAG TPA: thiamine pyrophosphate-binding protein [Acidimicrobiia bacterium]|nr:thiamine pyrophosphate-binding protein [Acidimicrobiia bacterium]